MLPTIDAALAYKLRFFADHGIVESSIVLPTPTPAPMPAPADAAAYVEVHQ
jgi:hypothetical protein